MNQLSNNQKIARRVLFPTACQSIWAKARDLVGGLEKVGLVVGERSQALLVLAAVGDVLLEDLPPVDGRGATVAPLEIRPLMRRRSSPSETGVSQGRWINFKITGLCEHIHITYMIQGGVGGRGPWLG